MKSAGFSFLPRLGPYWWTVRGRSVVFATLGRPMRLRRRLLWLKRYEDRTVILNLLGYQLGIFPRDHLLSRPAPSASPKA